MSEAERLAERLEELLAKATPGPWRVEHSTISWWLVSPKDMSRQMVSGVLPQDTWHMTRDQRADCEAMSNATLIVEAVNGLPTLLARIAALEEALRPFAGMRKSTEPEVSDLLNRSPSEQLRRQAELTERRDREIDNARLALGKGSE